MPRRRASGATARFAISASSATGPAPQHSPAVRSRIPARPPPDGSATSTRIRSQRERRREASPRVHGSVNDARSIATHRRRDRPRAARRIVQRLRGQRRHTASSGRPCAASHFTCASASRPYAGSHAARSAAGVASSSRVEPCRGRARAASTSRRARRDRARPPRRRARAARSQRRSADGTRSSRPERRTIAAVAPTSNSAT